MARTMPVRRLMGSPEAIRRKLKKFKESNID